MSADLFNLAPPLVPAGKPEDLLLAGQTLSASLSPLDNSLAIFVTNAVTAFTILPATHLIISVV